MSLQTFDIPASFKAAFEHVINPDQIRRLQTSLRPKNGDLA